jgi:prolyl-tRNA editing enzyme YbaK/EbsC (Cys-tRNA(Pro) deacylase)
MWPITSNQVTEAGATSSSEWNGAHEKQWPGRSPPGGNIRVTIGDVDNGALVAAALRAAGATGPIVEFSSPTATAVAAAAALECPVGAIANSLVFMADDSLPLLILASGAHRVDLDFVARRLGLASLRRASADEVRLATGQVIGGVSPVGHPQPISTFIDRALEAHDPLWAAAGTSHSVFSTTFDELIRITGARPIDVVGPDAPNDRSS